jgi:Rieske Fe-S protein
MVHDSRNILKTVLLCFFILTGINGCKDDYTSVIPYVPVNLNFNPTSYIELNIPAGSVYLEGFGFGGIIIVNNWGDSTTPFLAYDATCTMEVSSLVRVVVYENGSGIATCPKCGSQFMIFGGGGSPIKGPAVEPLRQYQTIFANGRIIVRN